jgi:hypothetical protein
LANAAAELPFPLRADALQIGRPPRIDGVPPEDGIGGVVEQVKAQRLKRRSRDRKGTEPSAD